MAPPSLVVVFSGKRKSGKDFVTDELKLRLGEGEAEIIRLSGPLKAIYAKDHDLDGDRLLDASVYKEKHRSAMIAWSDAKRRVDPHYFCRLAVADVCCPVVIVSDARRLTDMDFFQAEFTDRLLSVRVQASETVRAARGWTFQPGVDDGVSECGLDTFVSNVVFQNDGDDEAFERQMQALLNRIRSHPVIGAP